MVLVSHKYRFIYIKNVRTASSAIQGLFRKYCVEEEEGYSLETDPDTLLEVSSSAGIARGRKNESYGKAALFKHANTHVPARKIRNYVGEDVFNSYYKFASTRNPFDQMVSYYWWLKWYRTNSKREKWHPPISLSDDVRKDFIRFIQGVCQYRKSQSWQLHTIDDEPVCDYYIRFENLKEGVASVASHLGIPSSHSLTMGRLKAHSRPFDLHYSHYYDDELQQLAESHFEKELDFFGYKFERDD
tara:strand:+ start:218 stop:949 length:732 start_codon:yes stop_codon:yes gene_type:complete